MTLRQRALRAGAWTIASYSVEITTKFFSSLIMTRLLFPDAFGLIAAAMALIVGLQLLSDLGVRALVIQSPRGENVDFLRSAWAFQCSRGVLLWFILAAVCTMLSLPSVNSALPSATVFAHPSFPAVTTALGLTIVLSGIESTTLALNIRHLNFRQIVFLDLTARIVPLPIMITWAFLSPSVWSIVVGTLFGGLLRTTLSHIIIPGPSMRFTWRREHIKEIIAFGKWINLSSLATFFGSQSNVIILGLLLSAPTLGIYSIAKTLSDAVEGFLERLNSTMTLPILGQVLRDNPDNLKDRYYRFRYPIELVAAGAAGFLFAAGTFVVNALYDSRYSEAGLMLQILSFGLLIYPLQLIRSAFTAVGKANVVAWISILQAVSLVTGLSLGYYTHGSLGAIAGIAVSRVVPSLAILVLAYRSGWISPWKELRWMPVCAIGYMVGTLSESAFASFTLINIRQLFH